MLYSTVIIGGEMFRRAGRKDVKLILDFCLELKEQDAKMSFTDFDSEERVMEQIADPNIVLYLAIEDDVVAAMFRTIRGTGNKAHSVYVACAVRKAYRKRNLATDLTNFGLEDAKASGVKIARTKIYSWNKASIATILKCGFEEGGRVLMHQYEPSVNAYIDDLIFHKVL